MADVNLTQAEADALIAMEKVRVNDQDWEYPSFGGSISIPLRSSDKREEFLLDLSRGRIDLTKTKYQNRARHIVVLVRLELGGPPHRNPDDTEVPTPHLHVYKEGYGDKWAIPVPREVFPEVGNPWQALQDFLQFCNVTEPPRIRRNLFT